MYGDFCTNCLSFSVEQYLGDEICTKCFTNHGQVLVHSYLHKLRFVQHKKKYSAPKYRFKLLEPLRYQEHSKHWYKESELSEISQVISQKDWSWKQVKRCIQPNRQFRNKAVFGTPSLVGFKFKWYPMWDDLFNKAIKADQAIRSPKESKITNIYVLYQVVRMTGYYVDWIPISITSSTLRKLNIKWIKICKRNHWKYQKAYSFGAVDTTYINQSCSIIPVNPDDHVVPPTYDVTPPPKIVFKPVDFSCIEKHLLDTDSNSSIDI